MGRFYMFAVGLLTTRFILTFPRHLSQKSNKTKLVE